MNQRHALIRGKESSGRKRALKGEGKIRKEDPLHSCTADGIPFNTQELLSVFDFLSVAVLSVDRRSRIVYANTQAGRLLKRDAGTLVGQDLVRLVPGRFKDMLQEKIGRALSSRSEACFEAWCPEPVGLWFNCRCIPSFEGAVVVLEDISGRKKAETHRRKRGACADMSLQELDAIYRTAPVGLCVVDADLRIVRINDRMAGLRGIPPSEHIGRKVREIIPGISAMVEDILDAVLRTGEPVLGVKYAGIDLDGSEAKKSFVAQHFPLRDASDRVTGVSVVVEEVTFLEQARQALAVSDERYRTLFESMPHGAVEYDVKGRVVSANRAAREISGMDIEKLKGLSMSEVLAAIPEVCLEDGTPFERESLPAPCSLTPGTEPKNTVARVLFPGRQAHRWISYDEIPWFEPGNHNPAGTFTIFSDITELKNIQEALFFINETLETKVQEQTEELRQTIKKLERQNETLQTVFDSIPVMLIFHNPSRHVVMVNREYERLTGWSLGDAGAASLLDLSFPDPKHRREAWRFMKEARGAWQEFDIATRSGEFLTSSWLSARLSDGSLIGIGIDLRLDKLCKQMGKDVVKFASAVEQAGEGIILISPEGKIEYINPAFESMTGYTRSEVIGRPFCSFTDYLIDKRHRKLYDLISSRSEVWSGRQKRKRKSGEIYDASMSVTPVRDEAGRVINYVAIIRDITQEVALQQQLIHAQKMEALGTLAGGIAHDLKNIFTPILLDIEILMQDMGVQDPCYPILDEIHKATRLGVDLVSQILTFSRNAPHEKEPVDLYPVIRQFLSFLRSTMPPMIDINHQLHAKGAVIMADATQIQQVLINLAGNARHAMRKKGGVLTVGFATAALDEKAASEISPGLPPGEYVEIVIKDTGEGMNRGTLQRIFDPFFTTKRPGEGSGMGLSVVHGIVKDHGGAISVWSKPGKGSTFRVLLPRIGGNSPAGREED